MNRGLAFGWSKIFKSASSGKLADLQKNTAAIEEFGQGIHALEDAYAHRGTDIDNHNLLKDQWPSLMGASEDYKKAGQIAQSAVYVDQLMSNDFDGLAGKSFTIYTDGMSDEQKQQVLDKIKEFKAYSAKGKVNKLE